MLDIKFIRENPEIVKENIRKKFQDQKLDLVDKAIELDVRFRAIQTQCCFQTDRRIDGSR